MTAALINGSEIFYLAGHPDIDERTFSSCQNLRISGRVSVQQRARIRAAAVEHIDRGNLETTASFTVRRAFDSTAAAETFAGMMEDAAELDGVLIFRADGNADPDTYIYMCRAVVLPPEREVIGCSVLLHYTVAGGAFVPEGKTAPDPAPAIPPTCFRTSKINGTNGWEIWFDVGFDVPEILTGSASAGWTGSAATYLPIWSEDLTTWLTGKFSDCAGNPVDNGDGTWRYWMRSMYPVDSETKTGSIQSQNSGDVRNNPLTSLVIDSVAISLPHYPYTMPGDAATMQADIRAAGWSGATVTATTASDWSIIIPVVSISDFGVNSAVSWPMWSYTDSVGFYREVAGAGFDGIFVNSSAVRTFVPKQFFRLKIQTL